LRERLVHHAAGGHLRTERAVEPELGRAQP
jgi:hypothetical protein